MTAAEQVDHQSAGRIGQRRQRRRPLHPSSLRQACARDRLLRAMIGGVSEYAGGRLLVATPRLYDPNFFRTVVLVLEHSADGALGVVINRPSETDVAEALPP